MTQRDDIYEHLHYSPITSLVAIKEYGVTRLSAIIFLLKEEGWNIQDRWIKVKARRGQTRVKEYYFGE